MRAAAVGFELRGRFAGFFRDVFGKRRLVLRVEEEEIYLKIPKGLRRELDGLLRPGDEVLVSGSIDNENPDKRVVARVWKPGMSGCVSCPIRICARKNCWRSGGKELWHALQERIAARGLQQSVRLQAVDCLGHCRRGPNVECAGRDHHHCRPRDADALLAAVAD